MYDHEEIDADLLAEKYFQSSEGVSAWFKEASYGNVAFKGVVVGWIEVDKEYTANEMYNDKDNLFSTAA